VPRTEFHPAVEAWFASRFGAPTPAQERAWPEIARGRPTLIAAPTGSGKTLAAFLSAIDGLVREGVERGGLPDETRVVYVSPLKALSNDVRKNLEEPLLGIREALEARGLAAPEIRSLVRTGDTTSRERAAMTKRPPHILVTTPESLYVLLTSDGGRALLRTARVLIVDEIHAVVADKRGAHLALSLERLADLAPGLVRIGLSATQRPIEEVARFLVGASGIDPAGAADCAIADVGHRRALDLGVEVPRSPLEAVMATEVWGEVYDRLADLVGTHRTTLVFVNTRRIAERVARHLGERIGVESVAAHHGSLSREQRLAAEMRLKSGELRAIVATASLELGIDIGAVELVCTIGSTRSIATLLQRVGRSGHTLAGLPKGRVFPTSRDELVECAALLDAVRRGELEELEIPRGPLDILAQQIVAEVSSGERGTDELYGLVRRAWPYRELSRSDFDDVVDMLATGFATRRGRRGALVHHDAVHGRLRPRRGARLVALTSGGAIPDRADYRVILEPAGTFLGTVDEDFAVESNAGDVFQLGNASWRIARVDQGRVLVEDARGAPPTIPFWLGEAPGRTPALSHAVARVRQEVEERLPDLDATQAWLAADLGLGQPAAAQLVDYLGAARAALGRLPTERAVVLERFFDENGDQHVVIHAPFGSRINRAWGLALRKRFCRTFNFELQAAATEDALILSLGPMHSFPAADVFGFLHAATVRELLVQALLDAPMFGVRWRWNASRALAVPRSRGGRRVPPRLQRMQAEDLVATVFPDALACLETIVGDREVPDHPLVRQTIDDCLHEAMDVERLERILGQIESGAIECRAIDLTEPSPLAHEVLSARPYAFLDDAPLEERRTQAVHVRRWLDPQDAAGLGRLDAAAIERVRTEAWPLIRDADELHDALATLGFVTAEEGCGPGLRPFLDELIAASRATRVTPPGGTELSVAAERLEELLGIAPRAVLDPPIEPVRARVREGAERPDPLQEILRARLAITGPVVPAALARPLGLEPSRVTAALLALEADGVVMRGRYTPGASVEEWCDRALLARIHRGTIERLRSEIQPVTQQELVRFLLEWQHVDPARRVSGAQALVAVLEQLEGFEAPAAAWEAEILPTRVEQYDPAWLDALCLEGRFAWGRARNGEASPSRPVRTSPIVILPREATASWAAGDESARVPEELSAGARAVHAALDRHGASFFGDLVRHTGLLRTQVEAALAELVAAGLSTSDSFAGLRALLVPADKRPPLDERRRRSAGQTPGVEAAGRWSLLTWRSAEPEGVERLPERSARALLLRYGVVFRALLERESLAPPWRDLLPVYRRLEARGEIRGGRFVDGFSGEQYALAEAVAALRSLRREGRRLGPVSITAADPLNLSGIAVPGPRVAALTGNRLLLDDGVPVAVLEAGEPRFLADLDPAARWQTQSSLVSIPSSGASRSAPRVSYDRS
jgi:ATP-dependent helicase Lhr and Lhr-like helicase